MIEINRSDEVRQTIEMQFTLGLVTIGTFVISTIIPLRNDQVEPVETGTYLFHMKRVDIDIDIDKIQYQYQYQLKKS